MEMNVETREDLAIINLTGRLDSNTSNQLEKELDVLIKKVNTIVLDFSLLEYVSSAGLRVLLKTEKNISKTGKMVLRNVSDSIKEVFEITGFDTILNIE